MSVNERQEMYTYQMTIKNEDNCQRIISVSGDSFLEAVNNMKSQYGHNWVVVEYKLIHSNY